MHPDNAASRIRAARDDDLPALLRIEAEFPGDRLSRRQFLYHLYSPRARVRVVEDGSGYALLLLRRGTRVARLYSIGVRASARGRGIGAALLGDVESTARDAGADRLRLEVRADNGGAIAFYLAHGYRQFGRHAGYYDDGADALRMEKPLHARREDRTPASGRASG